MNKRRMGQEYEQIAGSYLESQGYEIIEYNYRCQFGEIDIVAKDKCDLVFIEVKYRGNERYGSPFEAVDIKKQHIIRTIAEKYMSEYQIPDNTYVRFDAVGITRSEISLIKNAFGGI